MGVLLLRPGLLFGNLLNEHGFLSGLCGFFQGDDDRFPVCLCVGQIPLSAHAYKVLPCSRTFCTGVISALKILVLEHIHHIFRNFHPESGPAVSAHDCECLTAGRLDDLLLLALIDPAGLLIQLAQVMHVVGCQCKDKAVLAGVDDGRGLSGNLLTSHKILDILRDNNLHSVVLTDTFCQLEHEVQRNWELGVNKYMRLVDHHHNLPVQSVFRIIITVLDDLVIYVFQNQQHLRIGDRCIPVRQHGLEVKYREILIGGDCGRSVPDIGISAAGGKLCHIVHQCPQHGSGIFVVIPLKLTQYRVIQIVKNRIILRPQLREVGFRRDPKVGI